MATVVYVALDGSLAWYQIPEYLVDYAKQWLRDKRMPLVAVVRPKRGRYGLRPVPVISAT